MFKNLKIARKLPIAFVLLTAIAAGVIGTIAYLQSFRTIDDSIRFAMTKATERIALSVDETYADNVSDVGIMATDYQVRAAYAGLSQAWTQTIGADPAAQRALVRAYTGSTAAAAGEREAITNAGDGSLYSAAHARWHGVFANMVEVHSFFDIFLIDPQGTVLYSYEKEADFGANVLSGELRDTDLGRVVREAFASAEGAVGNIDPRDHGAYSPLHPYSISGTYASFVAAPIIGDDGEVSGVLAFQVNADQIAAALALDAGLSVPNQAYLVNPDAETVYMHNVAETEPGFEQGHFRTNPAAAAALAGEEGTLIRETDVGRRFVAYHPVQIADETWAVVTKVAYDDIIAPAYWLRNVMLAVAVITVIVVGLVGMFFARSIVRPLQTLQAGLRKVQETRDMTLRSGSTANDEVGESTRAVDEILTVVDQALSDIQAGTMQVNEVARVLSSAAQSIASNSEVSSSSVEELSASVEETATQVRANAETAAQANDVVVGTADVVQSARSKIVDMVSAMDEIASSSRDIGKIIKVIDEIAFQTNLLALNAAVEAARAGQHGRGFAVVAAEVRNLAGRSAKAARETSDLIENSVRRVEAGVAISAETRTAFDMIATDIERVKSLVGDITRASDEQARGVNLINVAIGELSKVSRENSSQAEELATTAAELSATNQGLAEQVARFRVSGGLSPAAAAAPQPVAQTPVRAAAPAQRAIHVDALPSHPVHARNDGGMNGHAHPVASTPRNADQDQRGFGGF